MAPTRRFLARPSTWLAAALLSTSLQSASGPDGPPVSVSDLVVAVAVVLAGRELLHGEGRARARSVPAIGFWALGLVSAVTALAAQNFPDNVVGGVRFVQLFCLVPLTVLLAVRSRTDAQILLGGLLGLAFLQGGLGVVQAVTATGADIDGESVRAVGTFGAYDISAMAEITALGLVVCLALGVVLTGRARWWALGGAVFLALPLAFSLTRGAWVAAAVAAMVVVSRGRPLRMLGALVAVGAVAAGVLPVLVARGGELADRATSLVGGTPDQSLVDRFALWEAARQMAFDHPLTGVGPRAFAEHRDAYADLSLLGSSDIAFGGDFEQVALESPHNFYLLVASEQGLVAAGVFVVVFLVLLARGLVRSARPRSDLSTALALTGAGVLAYHLTSMLAADLGGPGSLFVAVALGLAGWAAADHDLPDDLPDDPVGEPAPEPAPQERVLEEVPA
ncbi:O-antigen ligase [Blastococcus aurantiacus]|uniref:O-antigen ligase n=1 Tax=Blastococcus aurantiacus TaxID=1550231 RepID=A0A1G7MSJ5_9ACTN|nr:O-antigen ligase family protein [Blastococcus aurantiacus]SDF64641.1 O-antigen ligase [Blastococcus aurantiacus]